jgi:circadian clock protein KaiC
MGSRPQAGGIASACVVGSRIYTCNIIRAQNDPMVTAFRKRINVGLQQDKWSFASGQDVENMKRKIAKAPKSLEKTPTGISGLDEITSGGLPKRRPTLICGGAGCGKTLTAMEFLVRGATEFDEPGVFMAFEENEEELARNVASLGFDLEALVKRKKLVLDYVRVERSEILETGEYDLEGLFVRLGFAIDSIGAKRVVLDTIEALFAGLPNEGILRAELRRLFRWLKGRGVTAVITAERGENTLTRHGLEEYVADCVVLLDHRVINQVSTRRLRIVKYRGSFHGTNEYPFLIGERGISVLPITSLRLNHPAPTQRVSTGVAQLDEMFSGKGFFRASTVLVSGGAGAGKTSLAATFAQAGYQRGERVLYMAFEESPEQIIRNMRSVGVHLLPAVQRGLLQFHAARPNLCGLELHLLAIHDLVRRFGPQLIIIDPITNLISVGDTVEVRSMLTRLIDFLKREKVTALFTSLTEANDSPDQSEVGVSSLIDTWISLRNLEKGGERNRALHVLKSRGMSHSNQVREFQLSNRGIRLVEVSVSGDEVLVGSARFAKEAQRAADARKGKEELVRLRRSLEHKRTATIARISALQAESEAELEELQRKIAEESDRIARIASQRAALIRERMSDHNSPVTPQANSSNIPKQTTKTATSRRSRSIRKTANGSS